MSSKKVTKKQMISLFIAITLILVGALVNISATTVLGTVKVQRVTYVDDLGNIVSAQLYIPKTATSENPAPAALTNHGGGNSAEAQSSYNIELARRGFVVLSWDASNHGSSEISADPTHGGEATYDFIQTLDFVKKDQIITSGHSMGGVYSYMVAQNHPDNVKLEIALGMNPAMNDVEEFGTNYVAIIGIHDESSLVRTNGDNMNWMTDSKYLTLFGLIEGDAIIPEQVYGDFSQGTGRIFHMPNSSHAGGMIDTEYVQVYLDAVQSVVEAPIPMSGSNQLWYIKDFAMIAQFIGLILLIFSTASILLCTEFFSTLILPARESVGYQIKTTKWWIALLFVMFAPSILFIWATTRAQVIKLPKFMALDGTANGFILWSLISAVALLVFFMIYHFTHGKKNGGNLLTYGLATYENKNKIGIGYVVKAFFFAAIVIGTGYIAYILMYSATCGDIHLWLASIRPITSIRVSYFPIYFILQFPFYLVGTLCGRSFSLNNGDRTQGKGMRNSLLLSLTIGILGLMIIFIVYNILFRVNGTVLFPKNRGYIYAGAIFSMIPAFAVGNTINCYVTNKTNSIYAGLFSGVLWSTWIMIAANAIG